MIKIQNNRSEIERALDYMEEEFEKLKMNRREYTTVMLTAEESLVCLMEHAPQDSQLEITFRRLFGNVTLSITAQGEEFDISESQTIPGGIGSDEMDEDMENAIRNLILRARSDSFRYKNKAHKNNIQIVVRRSERMQLYLTLGALLLSILLGIIFKAMLPEQARNILDTYVLSPVKTMFLNALKMIIGPVVFFSIVSCLS
ncbi:MAG: hypothetical protein LUE14_11115, partial [Clostridiales bacterium]|nr:hypothetical protein [Clostridiales bacterium]